MNQLKQFSKDYPVTAGLLGLVLAVFVAMFLTFGLAVDSNQAIFVFGGLYGELMRWDPSQWWRLLASNLVHIGLEHLLMNAFSLYIVGKIAEQIWTRRDYLLIFLLSGVFGGLLTIWLSPETLSAGASSSIFGLFAAVSVLGYFGRHPILKQMGKSFQAIILLNLVSNLFMPNINILGHLGGAVGGGLCALFLPNRVEPNLFSPKQRLLAFLSFVGLCLGILWLFYH